MSIYLKFLSTYQNKVNKNINNNFFYSSIIFIIFLFATVLKLHDLKSYGFIDSDVFAHHEFLLKFFNEGILEGKMGSMWGRPSRTFIQYFLGIIFGFTPTVYNLTAILFSIILTIFIFLFSYHFFNKLHAYYSLTLCSFSFSFFYWSKIAKFVIPSVIVLISAIFLSLKILRNYRKKNFKELFFLGLLLSLCITLHPNTLPTVVAIGSYFFFKELRLFLLYKKFDFISLSYIFFGFLSVVIFYELVFIILKYSPDWVVYENVSWISDIFRHSSVLDKTRGGIVFYSKIVFQEGFFFSCLIIFGIIIMAINLKKIKEDNYFLLYIIFATLFLYLITGVNPRLRNIFQLFVLLIIISSYGLAYFNFKFKFFIINILLALVIFNFMNSHFKYFKNFQNHDKMYNKYGGIEHIAMIETSKTTYHYEKYYYNKFYSNWEDLWGAYFCDDIKYFVIPPGVENLKPNYKEIITEKVSLVRDDKSEPKVKIINLDQNKNFFSNLYEVVLEKNVQDFKNIVAKDFQNFDRDTKVFLFVEALKKNNKNSQISMNVYKNKEFIYKETLFPKKKIIVNNIIKNEKSSNFINKTLLIKNPLDLSRISIKFVNDLNQSVKFEELNFKILAIKFLESINLKKCKKI